MREIPQGTVVGTPEIGTVNGPKQSPGATQEGGTETRDIAANTTQVRGWPPNPAFDIHSAAGYRESQTQTSSDLQIQPPPQRILRQLFARIFGSIGDSPAHHGFPFDAGWSVIPHQTIPRQPMGTGPMPKIADNNAPIPAIYAGNPRLP